MLLQKDLASDSEHRRRGKVKRDGSSLLPFGPERPSPVRRSHGAPCQIQAIMLLTLVELVAVPPMQPPAEEKRSSSVGCRWQLLQVRMRYLAAGPLRTSQPQPRMRLSLGLVVWAVAYVGRKVEARHRSARLLPFLLGSYCASRGQEARLYGIASAAWSVPCGVCDLILPRLDVPFGHPCCFFQRRMRCVASTPNRWCPGPPILPSLSPCSCTRISPPPRPGTLDPYRVHVATVPHANGGDRPGANRWPRVPDGMDTCTWRGRTCRKTVRNCREDRRMASKQKRRNHG